MFNVKGFAELDGLYCQMLIWVSSEPDASRLPLSDQLETVRRCLLCLSRKRHRVSYLKALTQPE